MRAFQDEGHVGVLIVGDYTTRIGDPSGRSEKRPMLDTAEIDANAKTYSIRRSRIIDPERTELRFNSEWLAKLEFAEVVRLARTITVARILERDDFAKRMKARRADLGLRAAVSADAGLRLGCDPGGRRARRDRSALQPARRPRGDARLRPRAAGRPHDVAPRQRGTGRRWRRPRATTSALG